MGGSATGTPADEGDELKSILLVCASLVCGTLFWQCLPEHYSFGWGLAAHLSVTLQWRFFHAFIGRDY